VFCHSGASASAQSGDILIVAGEKHEIFSNPLEPWLEERPDLRPQPEVEWSDLWRGYIATWAIDDGRLMLIDVEVRVPRSDPRQPLPKHRSVMSEMFPEEHTVFADWFTGYLIQPGGKVRKYIHRGYASIYRRYTIYTVTAGIVTETRNMTSRQYRRFRDKYLLAEDSTESELRQPSN
jgi:hypothetical protein